MANSRSVSWPNSPAPTTSSDSTGSAAATVVLIERSSTWFVDTLTRSPAVNPDDAMRRWFSRIRSNTTMLSYSE